MALAQTYVVAFDASQTQSTTTNDQTQTNATPAAQATGSVSQSTSTTTTTTTLDSTQWAIIIGVALIVIALLIGLAMRGRDSTTVVR